MGKNKNRQGEFQKAIKQFSSWSQSLHGPLISLIRVHRAVVPFFEPLAVSCQFAQKYVPEFLAPITHWILESSKLSSKSGGKTKNKQKQDRQSHSPQAVFDTLKQFDVTFLWFVVVPFHVESSHFCQGPIFAPKPKISPWHHTSRPESREKTAQISENAREKPT